MIVLMWGLLAGCDATLRACQPLLGDLCESGTPIAEGPWRADLSESARDCLEIRYDTPWTLDLDASTATWAVDDLDLECSFSDDAFQCAGTVGELDGSFDSASSASAVLRDRCGESEEVELFAEWRYAVANPDASGGPGAPFVEGTCPGSFDDWASDPPPPCAQTSEVTLTNDTDRRLTTWDASEGGIATLLFAAPGETHTLALCSDHIFVVAGPETQTRSLGPDCVTSFVPDETLVVVVEPSDVPW